MADKTVNKTYNQIGNITGSNNCNNIINVNSNKEEPVKNITFNCFKSASCFKGRLEVLTQIKEYFESNQIVVIYGAPGIGKTETARKFSASNINEFNGNIIWIFAETPENLQKCFKDLSETLGLYITDDVSQVYGKFRQSKALFIFDNVENITDVSKYLPCNELHSTIRVIITSQICPSDSSVAKIPLKALNMTDALQILEDKLGDKYHKHPVIIWEDLVKYLEGIPLSMQVVASLINKELSKPVRLTKFNLYDFISDLKKNFINSKIPDSEIIYYNKSVFNSISFALKRLDKKSTDVSLELLRFIAYLNADHIIHDDLLLAPSINKSEELLEDALNKLEEYSLIQVENAFGDRLRIKVHRTIQLVSRYFDLNERNGTMFKTLIKAFVLIHRPDIDDFLISWEEKFIFRLFHCQLISEYIQQEEYKNKSIEFFYENKNLAESYIRTLAITHCFEVLRELLPKFKEEFMETDKFNEILNIMLLDAIKNLNNNLDTIIFLIENGAKIDLIPNKFNGFHCASIWVCIDLFDLLLESNDSQKMINSKTGSGQTILYRLVDEYNTNIEETMECMDHLIYKWNADIFIRTNDGLTILHIACKNLQINLEFIKFLVEKHKCKNLVNTQCDEGKTPLQYLFESYYLLYISGWKQNKIEIFIYFVTECGADISIQDNNKWNSLFYVCRYGNAEMIEFVLKTRDCCDLINFPDVDDDVAFTQLLLNKNIKENEIIELMKLFIENGMNFNIRNKKNKTLVEIAEEKELKELSTEIKFHLEKEKLPYPDISSQVACNVL